MKSKRVLQTCAVLAVAAGLSSQARADIWWQLKDVAFDDRGAVGAGAFALDVYDYVLAGSASAATTDGSMLGGLTYNEASINNVSGTGKPDDAVTFVSSANPYGRALWLKFEFPLTMARVDDPIVSGWECVGYCCPASGAIRNVTGGYASAPEAPTWAMIIVGAGLLASGRRFLRSRPQLRSA